MASIDSVGSSSPKTPISPSPSLRSEAPPTESSKDSAGRLFSVFPQADGSNQTSEPFPLSELLDTVVTKNTGHVLVQSATYCKKQNGLEHEFIFLTVADDNQNYQNALILERAGKRLPGWSIFRISQCLSWAFRGGAAIDQLVVSADGSATCLESKLLPYARLNQFTFTEESLLLSDLVMASRAVSILRNNYNLWNAQCYWFASSIWECIGRLCPSTTSAVKMSNRRGRFGYLFHQRLSQDEMRCIAAIISGISSKSKFSTLNYPKVCLI